MIRSNKKMKMTSLPVNCWILAALLGVVFPAVELAPTNTTIRPPVNDITAGPIRVNATTTEATTTTTTNTTRGPNEPEANSMNSADYIISDLEYAQLLERFERQARDSVSLNPDNYVDSDASLEDILRLIEMRDNSTQSPASELQNTTQFESLQNATESNTTTWYEFLSMTSTEDYWTQNFTTENGQVNEGNSTEEPDYCLICSDHLHQDDHINLECGHVFHTRCVAAWTGELPYTNHIYTSYRNSLGDSCPICKLPISSMDRSKIISKLQAEGRLPNPSPTSRSQLPSSSTTETYLQANYTAQTEQVGKSAPNRNSTSYLLDECPICIEGMRSSRKIDLVCGHLFHTSCIANWIVEQPKLQGPYQITCPLCRHRIYQAEQRRIEEKLYEETLQS